MHVFVGTSGWYYEWNRAKSLDWFVSNSGLNSVELNSSFYRFPSLHNVKSWARKGKDLRWSVKVNRSVTHNHMFNDEALEIWTRFRELFEPLDEFIDYYLFQAPPRFRNLDRIIEFAQNADMGERFAFEIRNRELLGNDDKCNELAEKVTLVSVDSPDFRNRIFPGKNLYLRMHGREEWYQYDYSEQELNEISAHISKTGPERINVYFNNNHNMLNNARRMLDMVDGAHRHSTVQEHISDY
ncbi:DUF72 domain-containing protein [Methanolobus halotolerans]|uniref:DUF72 domain-containing protein n=1 Tax=Methanolobus halotolerans TaxID=2052935 RepID=A0A4E0PV69_9EURY|nr:DUF72 domain-containing protein [Methanolobus halotolerans]TGC07511.1 DUF72 domain-containing protein [Methanolobus halotolerans]